MTTAKEKLQAYREEINNCNFNLDLGLRVKARPHKFCDSVTIEKTLEVTDLKVTGKFDLVDTASFDAGNY